MAWHGMVSDVRHGERGRMAAIVLPELEGVRAVFVPLAALSELLCIILSFSEIKSFNFHDLYVLF